jgi:hypothetical protein
MTGGSSRPLNEKAALPVWGSLIAVSTMGERASGGLERSSPDAPGPCALTNGAVSGIPLIMARQIEDVRNRPRGFEVRDEIIVSSFQSNIRQATGDHTYCGKTISTHSTMQGL